MIEVDGRRHDARFKRLDAGHQFDGPGRAHALMHATVFVWGFTAILGRLISLTALTLVWYRLVVVVTVMAGSSSVS